MSVMKIIRDAGRKENPLDTLILTRCNMERGNMRSRVTREKFVLPVFAI
jgi:hypothetical protein